MTFHVYDASVLGEIYLTSEDYEHDFIADVREAYDAETETYDVEMAERIAEEQIKARFGADTVIDWDAF